MTTRQRLAVALCVGGVIAADAISKRVAESQWSDPVELLLGARLALSHNSGIAFGGLAGLPAGVVLAIVGLALAGLVTASLRGWFDVGTAALTLLIGGATANLIDRVPDSRVTDFIDLGSWPAFNLADIAITIGVGLVLVGTLRTERQGRSRTSSVDSYE